jgi:hypothetical protein
MKRNVFGEFDKTFKDGFIDFKNENSLVKSLKILDFIDQNLREGELEESIKLIENLEERDKIYFSKWIDLAKLRLKAQQTLDLLKFHNDVVADQGVEILNRNY